MSTKVIELALANQGKGCLGKAADDEPVFILRAQDQFAPRLVMEWASEVENAAIGLDPHLIATDKTKAKVKEARALAFMMQAWQEMHSAKIPD